MCANNKTPVSGEATTVDTTKVPVDTPDPAGGVGSDSFTDVTGGSFVSETHVETSDVYVCEQPRKDDWTVHPYWKSEVSCACFPEPYDIGQ